MDRSWQSSSDRATITDANSFLADVSGSRKDSLPSTPIMSRSVSRVNSPAPPGSPAPKYILHTTPRRTSVTTENISKDGKVKAARLVYSTSFGGKMNFTLAREETTIGRKEDNHIVLTCAKISKYHAVMKRIEG
jgi:hypothetical protein